MSPIVQALGSYKCRTQKDIYIHYRRPAGEKIREAHTKLPGEQVGSRSLGLHRKIPIGPSGNPPNTVPRIPRHRVREYHQQPACSLLGERGNKASLIVSYCGSIDDHQIVKSMSIILRIQSQSYIQSKCQIQSLKSQHSAFPVQRSSAWMKQNFELKIYSKITSKINLIFDPSAKFKVLKLNIQPSRSNGHQLAWSRISSCQPTQK